MLECRKFWYDFMYSRHYVFCLYHVNIYLNDSGDVTFYCTEGKNIAGKLYARDSSELCHKTDSPPMLDAVLKQSLRKSIAFNLSVRYEFPYQQSDDILWCRQTQSLFVTAPVFCIQQYYYNYHKRKEGRESSNLEMYISFFFFKFRKFVKWMNGTSMHR